MVNDQIIIKKMSVDECKEIIGVSYATFFLPVELDKFKGKGNLKSLFGRYLVKKSLLDYFNSSNYLDISILNDPKGKPEIFIHGELMKKVNNMGVKKVLCSISHSKNWLASMVVIE